MSEIPEDNKATKINAGHSKKNEKIKSTLEKIKQLDMEIHTTKVKRFHPQNLYIETSVKSMQHAFSIRSYNTIPYQPIYILKEQQNIFIYKLRDTWPVKEFYILNIYSTLESSDGNYKH